MNNLVLTKKQFNFYTSKKKFTLFSGGIGSGKTFVGSQFCIKKIADDPTAVGLIAANTYRQLNNATLAQLFGQLDEYGIAYKYNKQTGILKITQTGTIIHCYSLESFNNIRGIEIGWFYLDETRDTKIDAFKVIIGRLRGKSKKLEGRLTSSPSGFNWLYDYFAGDKKTDDFELITGASTENPHLPDDYVESLKDAYDDKVYQQEVEGKFINITQGAVYYSFSREKNVTTVNIDPTYPLWVCMDFNINPMSAAIFQSFDNKLFIVDEFVLMSSDTKEMADEIKKKYGAGLRVIPDSTGKRTQTSSAGFSDHAILERSGFKVMPTRNPFRLDRYNTVNNLLDKSRLLIDSKCIKLIRDFEQVTYKQGSSQIDGDTDKTLTHISDSVGYAAWFHYPIIKPLSATKLIER